MQFAKARLPFPTSVSVHVGLPLAAAATLLLVFSATRLGDGAPAPHRGSPDSEVPVAMAPIGEVAEVPLLQWAPVLGADRYRVTIFDAESRIVLTEEVGDTLLVLPESLSFEFGKPYVWLVSARTGWDRWSASAPTTFTLVRRGTP